MITRQLILAH